LGSFWSRKRCCDTTGSFFFLSLGPSSPPSVRGPLFIPFIPIFGPRRVTLRVFVVSYPTRVVFFCTRRQLCRTDLHVLVHARRHLFPLLSPWGSSPVALSFKNFVGSGSVGSRIVLAKESRTQSKRLFSFLVFSSLRLQVQRIFPRSSDMSPLCFLGWSMVQFRLVLSFLTGCGACTVTEHLMEKR